MAKISTAPLVATHSNAHSLSASSRNLTDDQIAHIGRTRGMIGLNFANGFLRRDGGWSNDTSLATMIAHLDHLMSIAGEDCVGLGSDFDGARISTGDQYGPGPAQSAGAMRAHGYSDALIKKLCYGNWLRVLELTWGA